MKKKAVAKPPVHDLNTPEAVEEFRLAAEAFNAKHCKTPEAALAILVKEGIYTKTGRLTKNYR